VFVIIFKIVNLTIKKTGFLVAITFLQLLILQPNMDVDKKNNKQHNISG